jgi:hypothetical protein
MAFNKEITSIHAETLELSSNIQPGRDLSLWVYRLHAGQAFFLVEMELGLGSDLVGK